MEHEFGEVTSLPLARFSISFTQINRDNSQVELYQEDGYFFWRTDMTKAAKDTAKAVQLANVSLGYKFRIPNIDGDPFKQMDGFLNITLLGCDVGAELNFEPIVDELKLRMGAKLERVMNEVLVWSGKEPAFKHNNLKDVKIWSEGDSNVSKETPEISAPKENKQKVASAQKEEKPQPKPATGGGSGAGFLEEDSLDSSDSDGEDFSVI